MFSISPDVQVREFDLTTAIRAASSAAGAFAGNFEWGPANEISSVLDENQLISIFGEPTRSSRRDFLTAASFLKYAGSLNVVRVVSENSLNASSDGNGVLIRNRDEYDENYETLIDTFNQFTAKYPGTLGNNIRVEIVNGKSFRRNVTGEFTSSDVTLTYTGTGSIGDYITVGSSVRFESSTAKVIAVDEPGSTATLSNPFTNDLTGTEEISVFWKYSRWFNTTPPSTSAWGEKEGIVNDEIHIAVIDDTGKITGLQDSVLETFEYVSLAPNAKKENGSTNYYKNILTWQSRYVYLTAHPTEISNSGQIEVDGLDYSDGTPDLPIVYNLSAGINEVPTAAEYTVSYDLFKNSDEVNIRYIFGTPMEGQTDMLRMANILNDITHTRKDCIGFVSPPVHMSANLLPNKANHMVINFFDQITSSSYLTFDQTAVQVYDKYNDEYVWIPACGHHAGLWARSHRNFDAWWSAAGYDRGQLIGVRKIAFNPNKSERDILYSGRVNSIVHFPGEGILMYGDKTALAKPSAFGSINVRNLFISIEKAIADAAKYLLFEFNDEFTRALFRGMVEPYLREVQGRRGIYDFRVVADETNNTPFVIDNQGFVGDIYVSPARSINTIQLNFIATRTGVDFEEIVDSFTTGNQ